MALTPGGTPYVESSDLVADYPTVSLALAEHIDDLPAKVLQVVRATDVTNRTTTNSSYVDANISVTITPQKSDSAIILMWTVQILLTGTNPYGNLQITDNSNNAISGAEDAQHGVAANSPVTALTLIGYDTPATILATTYKGRFRRGAGTSIELENSQSTGQLYAIEVSA
jgi:hypothetical protein